MVIEAPPGDSILAAGVAVWDGGRHDRRDLPMLRVLPLLLIFTAATRAADSRGPTPLSPQEITEGWVQLFDGETTFGWLTNGPVRVEGGELVLGGGQQATAR